MMTKRRPPSRRGSKLMSDEDLALWRFATGSLDPLQGILKSRVIFGAEAELRSTTAPPPPKEEVEVGAWPSGKYEPSTHAQKHKKAPAGPAPPKVPPLADFDRRAARRIRSGRVEIEARIDLHGLRQNEAHAALRGFLMSAHARGLRWVLVITGKGSSGRGDEIPPWPEPERGVLKKNVPRWLAEPDMRAVVVSYTAAAIPHGGEGALYIQLRSKRR